MTLSLTLIIFQHHQNTTTHLSKKEKKSAAARKRRSTVDKKKENKAKQSKSEPLIVLKEFGLRKKPKVELLLPGWRVVEVAKLNSRKEKLDEDLSDEAFIRRHEAAEMEEVELWDRWKAIREDEGRKITGRSTSSGWREADLGPGAPRLRSERVGSCPSPGRLSPSSLEKVKEICVLPSTPTSVTVHIQPSEGARQIFQCRSSDKRRSFDSVSSNNQTERKNIPTTEVQLEKRRPEEHLPVRRKTTGSSRLRRSLPDILSKENMSPGSEPSQSDRILKDSNVEEKKKTR